MTCDDATTEPCQDSECRCAYARSILPAGPAQASNIGSRVAAAGDRDRKPRQPGRVAWRGYVGPGKIPGIAYGIASRLAARPNYASCPPCSVVITRPWLPLPAWGILRCDENEGPA